jgi:glycosyltransferase involved in cell wall biosynthesis
VIPAYENLDMLARCLLSVAAQRDANIEIIVTDDSESARIRDFIAAVPELVETVRYLRGPRSGNPVENWNAGLDQARAPIHLVIHQDEFLVDPIYLRRAIDALRRDGTVAARAGVCVIGVNRPSRFALAAPIASRLWRARHLLPMINWMGPTAVFAFRAGPRFDPAMVQLVDVEFYGRVLRSGRLARLSGVSVVSLGHHQAQITARIDPTAAALKELSLLAGRSPPVISPFAHTLYASALKLRARLR